MLYFAIDPVQAQKIFQSGFSQAIRAALDPDTRLLNSFPQLTPGSYRKLGGPTAQYNCIAWAAGKIDEHWWPGQVPQSYWPPGIPADTSLNAFIHLFRSLEYDICDSSTFQRRYEKVAIFVKNQHVTHAARQVWSGRWTSKLGPWELIEHDLEAVAGIEYGNVEQIMRRKRGLRRIFWEAVRHAAETKLELSPVITLCERSRGSLSSRSA